MSENSNHVTTRRQFLRNTGRVAGAMAVTAATVPFVHAGENNTVRLVLVGCGGRGTGAAANALSVKNGPIELVAMADVFENRLSSSYRSLNRQFSSQVKVREDRRFIGFDAYRKAVDCIGPGDVAIFATPPAFRWVHFGYAIEKGVNAFMEKPVTVDGPTTRKMLELAEKSVKKNLKVGVGLMVRHCRGRQALNERIHGGEIGDIIAMRAYRMGDGGGTARPKPKNISELLYQVQRFHAFLWASGGVFSDYYIHQIDECCWMKGTWPTQAQATGGRHFRRGSLDQNFDNYAVEYTFPDGGKLFYYGRNISGCHNEFASYALGAKGSAVISTSGHTPGKVRTYRGHDMTKQNQIWAFPQPEQSPYDLEWQDLIAAIRQDIPYNEVKRGAEASLVTSMGRMAAHTGQIVTWDDILHQKHEFAPTVDKLVVDGPAPLQLREDGTYPVPQPGITRRQEY